MISDLRFKIYNTTSITLLCMHLVCLFFSFEKNVVINPIKKINEKIKMALPYPPKKVTSAPIKNTTVAVNNLPILKQNPVAEALTNCWKQCGM